MSRPTSAIPVGTQFSPALISLPHFVRALIAHSGNKVEIEAAVWDPAVRLKRKDELPTRRNRSLPVEAAVQYGLLTDRYESTDLARDLADRSESEIYQAFARHILLNLRGLRVVRAVEEMRAEGMTVTGDGLARYLTNQGLPVTVHNTAINSLRMWLERAGVFRSGWDVDQAALQLVLGLSHDQVTGLAQTTASQRAFLEALCRLDPAHPVSAAKVRDVAEAISGLSFDRQSLPKAILEPLRTMGLLEFTSGGTKGGKAAVLMLTPIFRREVLEPFLKRTLETLDPAVTAYYARRPADIFAGMESADKAEKGRALEALAIHVGMRLLGLRFVAWRKRAVDTGGAEIDAIMTGVIGIAPTLWQIQTKNTPSGRVSVEDVSRELGVARLTKASHVLLIANCRISVKAMRFARKVMDDEPITIFLVGGSDFGKVRRDSAELLAILKDQASSISRARGDEARRIAQALK